MSDPIILKPGEEISISVTVRAAPVSTPTPEPPEPEPEPEPEPPSGQVGGYPEKRGPQVIHYSDSAVIVGGTSQADMHAARDKAGTGGFVFVPAGSYPGFSTTVPGQRWQYAAGAVIRDRITPVAQDVVHEGGEMRGGAWLSRASNAHGNEFRHMRIRGVGIANESRSRLVVANCDMREIAGDFVKLWYDTPSHADVVGLTIEDNIAVRTSYSVNGVAMFAGTDGAGHHLIDPIFRNNWCDNGFDKNQGPGGIGAFGLFEMWGCIRQLNEYNDLRGGGFLNSNVRSRDGIVRWNKGLIDVKKAWAFYESGGTGTGGDDIYENEVVGTVQRNGVLIATATPNPNKTVTVRKNRIPNVRQTSDPAAPGYAFSENAA